jgi:hypothetical protein
MGLRCALFVAAAALAAAAHREYQPFVSTRSYPSKPVKDLARREAIEARVNEILGNMTLR